MATVQNFLMTAMMLVFGGLASAAATYTASGNAPGGDVNVTIDCPSGSGVLTVSTVRVAGALQTRGTEYYVTGEGTSAPAVVWYPGHVPAAGAAVVIVGGTANGTKECTGTLVW